MMTARNSTTDNTGGGMTPWQANAASVASPILIAEDHLPTQNLLCWTLQLAGYRPTVCANRQAALTWMDSDPEGCPTLLLLDLSLLCATEAADFLRRLRARWWDAGRVPPQIIVLTTSTQVQAGLGSRELVLQKPFHILDLLALIQQMIPLVSESGNGSLRKAHMPDH